jgi:hypothetical protein
LRVILFRGWVILIHITSDSGTVMCVGEHVTEAIQHRSARDSVAHVSSVDHVAGSIRVCSACPATMTGIEWPVRLLWFLLAALHHTDIKRAHSVRSAHAVAILWLSGWLALRLMRTVQAVAVCVPYADSTCACPAPPSNKSTSIACLALPA